MANPSSIRKRPAAPGLSTISLRFYKAPKPPMSLLELPTEIRLQIFGYLLLQTTPIVDPYAGPLRVSDKPPYKSSISVHVGILHTCRRVYREGSPLLYQNTFRFTEPTSFSSFILSPHPIHRCGVRHLQICTAVAEGFLYRRFLQQGRWWRDYRVRGRAGWDWPFFANWQFPNLLTLKLELLHFNSLPVGEPPNKLAKMPRFVAEQARKPWLTRGIVVAHIINRCMPRDLKILTINAVSDPLTLTLLEIRYFIKTFAEDVDYLVQHLDEIYYLENRIEGPWETVDGQSMTQLLRLIPSLQSMSPDWILAAKMLMRRKFLKDSGGKLPARKDTNDLLWTW